MLKITPSLEEIKKLSFNNNKKYIVPVWTEIIADLETPVSVYNKVCKDEKHCFLLESAEVGASFGKYSFIGMDPLFVLKSDVDNSTIYDFKKNKTVMNADSPYSLLEKMFSEYDSVDFDSPFLPGAVGYFGYDTIKHIEPSLKKAFKSAEQCVSFPDAYFMIGGNYLVFDHVKHKIYIIHNFLVDDLDNIEELYEDAKIKINEIFKKLELPHELKPLKLSEYNNNSSNSSNISKEEWKAAVNIAKEHIESGDIFQVVLSQRFCVEKENVDSFAIYRALRSINPSPYLYYLNFDDFQIIGSSPEALVKCSKDNIVQTKPIAGTRKRGATPQKDKFYEDELINDPKERAEHIMLVDLARNDLGKISEYGSVKLDKFMEVEKFSHVMHIVSDVSGKLKENHTSIDLIQACFPAGTVSGAPKVKAMEIIYQLEKSARGPYAGCIGYLGFNNEVNMAITLRTMLVKDEKVFIQAGAGIVADSEPELEYLETQNKAAALIQAVSQLKNN